MKTNLSKILIAAGVASALTVPLAAHADISLYSEPGFRGEVFATPRAVNNLNRVRFNDAASSVVIDRGRWEVCDDAGFAGRCVVLRDGSYADLSRFGLSNNISSVRPVGYNRDVMEPDAAPYQYRRRAGERLFDAPVTSVRAVYARSDRRCWIEREPTVSSNDSNVGGALLGAIVGGVLGHQVGGGRGRDIATAGGAVAGAAIGSRAGGGSSYGTRDVERCSEASANNAPEYYDVTYEFRGRSYNMQSRFNPGPTVVVNRDGVPRG